MPTFNVEHYVERALSSALAQTASDLEVLVVDESTDATSELARRVAVRDRRVRVLSNPERLGLAASRNRALDEAQGDWVALLDGDDAWLPERLEHLLAAAETSGADFVSDDIFRVERDGRTARNYLRHDCPSLVEDGRSGWMSATELLVYQLGYLKPIMNREFLSRNRIRYNPALQLQEDLHFFFWALLAGARWLQLPDAYYLYIQRPGSAMTEWVDRYERSNLLYESEQLLDHPVVRRDRVLFAAVQRFVDGQRVALRWGKLRRDLHRRYWAGIGRNLLDDPAHLPRVVAHGIRSWVARRQPIPADLCLLNEARVLSSLAASEGHQATPVATRS
jgi:succinoglycan biosynthesis protein ExoO